MYKVVVYVQQKSPGKPRFNLTGTLPFEPAEHMLLEVGEIEDEDIYAFVTITEVAWRLNNGGYFYVSATLDDEMVTVQEAKIAFEKYGWKFEQAED